MSSLAFDLSGPADAPLLVLGPSLGTTRELWRDQLPALSRHLRVLRYDHRGHGGSAAPPGPYRLDELGADVLALLDEIGTDRVYYAGVSLGAMIGMWLAAHAADRIGRLALICTSAYLPPAADWLERARRVRADGMGAIAPTVVARWFTERLRVQRPEVTAAYLEMISSVSPEGYAGCCEAIATMDLRPVLPHISAATLVVAGAEDPATPPEHARTIAAAVTGARMVVVSEGAHLTNVEQSATVTGLLLSHFVTQEAP
jgi:3-oxoadipate enol-lactonase